MTMQIRGTTQIMDESISLSQLTQQGSTTYKPMRYAFPV